MAKEVTGYCQVDAQSQISRISRYVDFCEHYNLLPLGIIPEKALRPLITKRNADIAPIVVSSLKSALKKKGFQVTNRYVRKLIAIERQHHIDTPPYPDKHYRCIVIDPPWPTSKIIREARPRQHEQLDYPTLSCDEIAALPIAELANPSGCHIFLWTTHKFLPTALDIFTKWGASYQCVLTWVKPSGMTPFSWMYNTEHILFGRIGSLDLLQNGVKLAFAAPNIIHSRKPDVFYDIVRTVSPTPRLDMFARETRLGFDAYGNEVTKLNDLREGLVARAQV